MSDHSALKATATVAYKLFDNGDIAGVDTLYAPDLGDHNPVSRAASAIEGMPTMARWTRDGFTDPHHEILYQAVIDDEHVVTHWRMTGRDPTFVGTDRAGSSRSTFSALTPIGPASPTRMCATPDLRSEECLSDTTDRQLTKEMP
jgi:hypothetical protein